MALGRRSLYLGQYILKVYSGDIVESGTVTDPLKVYALDDYGDLETDEDQVRLWFIHTP